MSKRPNTSATGGVKATPAATSSSAPKPVPDGRLERLFAALRDPETDTVRVAALLAALESAGLSRTDVRLRGTVERLDNAVSTSADEASLDRATFCDVLHSSISLVERALRRDLVVPDFEEFRTEVQTIFEGARAETGGAVASYIPQLARVDGEKFALGVCTIDGQRFGLGDSDERFCLQSSCKPINYLLALHDEGPQTVHQHVGREPSGRSFNELSLNTHGRPHNPMINAGAIMSCSLIGRDLAVSDRFDHVVRQWTRLAGGQRPGFDNSVYLSERRTADRNFALGYFMRENNAFPADTDLTETLEFYFQCCSLEFDVEAFSVVAATLANGGVCPLTDERVFSPDSVQKCLSLMYSCGMYDFSGEWAFTVGLPAKSGVSGVILVVVPNTLGFAIWSPRLDQHGNSCRGIRFCEDLVRRFNFHHYDNLVGGTRDKRDPRRSVTANHSAVLGELLWAASNGDVSGMQRIAVRGFDLGSADYDGRTALHLAASEGRLDAVEYLVARGVDRAPLDRWGGTPLDDARRERHADVEAFLGRIRGDDQPEARRVG